MAAFKCKIAFENYEVLRETDPTPAARLLSAVLHPNNPALPLPPTSPSLTPSPPSSASPSLPSGAPCQRGDQGWGRSGTEGAGLKCLLGTLFANVF